MKKYVKWLHRRAFGHLASKADIENLYVQLSALLEVREIIGPGIPFGPLRGWALSPDALLTVLRDVVIRREPRVIEFGSGESTIAIAATLRRHGNGTLMTIEHDATFANQTLLRLKQSGLDSRVEMKIVPLREYEPRFAFGPFISYDLTGLEADFDIAVVDGPVTPVLGAATRSVPLEWCLTRLAEQRTLYLDDAMRSEERAIVDALRIQWQKIDVESVAAEKGMYKFVVRAPIRQ
jgi:methyltransferase family protein